VLKKEMIKIAVRKKAERPSILKEIGKVFKYINEAATVSPLSMDKALYNPRRHPAQIKVTLTALIKLCFCHKIKAATPPRKIIISD
jgi:hypothetical protein